MNYCPLCKINEDEIIFENEYVYFLQQEQEVLIGSGIIIPKAHRETVFDLTREEWNATFSLLKDVKNHLDNTYKPDGYNIGWNVRKIGGQEIMHAHLHVIPRFKEEPFANRGIRYWLKQKENKHRINK